MALLARGLGHLHGLPLEWDLMGAREYMGSWLWSCSQWVHWVHGHIIQLFTQFLIFNWSTKVLIDSTAVWALEGAQSCSTLQAYELQPTKLLCHWNSPGKNTGVGSHFLLRGNFLTQRLKLSLSCFLHWQAALYHWCHMRSPCTWYLA